MKNLYAISKSGIMIFAATMLSNTALAAPAAETSAEETQTISLSDFNGHWESKGPAFGQNAHSIMKWETVLGGKFMRLSYSIQTTDTKLPTTIFEGVGYYKQTPQSTMTAFWADSSGDLHPISAKMNQDTLMSTWGVAGGKLGRTYYRLINSNKIEVTDWLLTESGWRQFNQNSFNRQNPGKENHMQLGNFSLSLSVKDLNASETFYQKLGFSVFGGDKSQNWLIMKNGDTVIGLFQGMFPTNTLTFNPGWDNEAQTLNEFTDVRKLQHDLKAQGVEFVSEADPDGSGPAGFMIMDPDGNPILFDQHVE